MPVRTPTWEYFANVLCTRAEAQSASSSAGVIRIQ